MNITEIATGVLLGTALASTGMNVAVIGPWLPLPAILGAEVGAGIGRPEYAVARVLGAVLWPVLGLTLQGVPGEAVVLFALVMWGITIRNHAQGDARKAILAVTAIAIIGIPAVIATQSTGSIIGAVFALNKYRSEPGSAGGGFLAGLLGAAWYGVPPRIITATLKGSSEFALGITDALTLGLALSGLGERSALNAFVDVQLDPIGSIPVLLGVTILALGLSRIKTGFEFPREAGLLLAAAMSVILGHTPDLLWMGLFLILGEVVERIAGPEFRFAGLSIVPVAGVLL